MPAHAWRAVFTVARAERCAPLAWSRSGDVIRASAPPDVVSSWRELWVLSAERVECANAVLSPIVRRLEREHVIPMWLKGAALSQRLYGDVAARDSVDVDWLVATDRRGVVEAALLDEGWQVAEGSVSSDQTFALDTLGGRVFLEVHSSLLHERLSYLSMPLPLGTRTSLCGSGVTAFIDEPLLPLYLGLHLAGHRAPPLLWWIDLTTLLDGFARPVEIEALASRLGLGRYLAWMRRGCQAVNGLASGDVSCGTILGVSPEGRIDVHPSLRHIRLAPNPVRAVAAAKAWVLPPWTRGESRWGPVMAARRVARYAPDLLRRREVTPQIPVMQSAAPSGGDAGPAQAPVAAGTSALMEKLRVITSVGGEAWVEGAGFSMWPFIRPGSRVLIASPGRLAVGSIILVPLHGRPVVHRIQAIDGDRLVTAGDANLLSDAPIPRSQVIGRALAAEERGKVVALLPTLRFGALAFMRYVRYSARRHVARAARTVRSMSFVASRGRAP